MSTILPDSVAVIPRSALSPADEDVSVTESCRAVDELSIVAGADESLGMCSEISYPSNSAPATADNSQVSHSPQSLVKKEDVFLETEYTNKAFSGCGLCEPWESEDTDIYYFETHQYYIGGMTQEVFYRWLRTPRSADRKR